MNCLNEIKDALLTVSQNVGHYSAFKAIPPYIIWAEDGQGESLRADDAVSEQVITGTIDLYTKNLNGEPLVESIQSALDMDCISWRLNSVQYEDDTKLLHYEWAWEVVNCGDDIV